MRILIISACLIAAISVAGCGSGSSSESASSSDKASSSNSTSSTESTAASTKSGESSESDGSEELKASATPPAKPPTKIEFPVGLPKDQLATKDLKPGAGATAKAGDEVTVQYVGLGFKTKKAFDSSWEGGEPLSFELGAGKVIEGWDQGIEGMKVGGRREMLIPAKLAYGSEGTESIAPNEDLLFIVDLLAVKPGA